MVECGENVHFSRHLQGVVMKIMVKHKAMGVFSFPDNLHEGVVMRMFIIMAKVDIKKSECFPRQVRFGSVIFPHSPRHLPGLMSVMGMVVFPEIF